MGFRQRLILIVICSMAFGINLGYGGIWPDKEVPIPPDSKEEKQEKRMIAGQEIVFTYYANTNAPYIIQDFYRKLLAERGWQSKDLLAQMNNMHLQDLNTNYMQQALKQNLVFEKEGKMLIINFVPEEYAQDKKTYFTIAQMNIDTSAALPENADFVPVLLTRPKKEAAPVYPGASLISLQEEAGMQRATYLSRAPIDEVFQFYKENMVNDDWELIQERPVERKNTGGPGAMGDLDNCPSCQQAGLASNKPKEMLFGELVFSNKRGDSCRIGFAYILTNETLKNSLDFTSIMVDYAEKKK